MSVKRLGQLLQEMTPLSDHDVDEILHEQEHSERPFGEIALNWGLCSAEDVVRAWCLQLQDEARHIDLGRFGVDARATVHFTPEMARRYQVIPVRAFDDKLVVAGEKAVIHTAADELRQKLQVDVLFVTADRRQVQEAIYRYYASEAPENWLAESAIHAARATTDSVAA